MNKIGIDIGGSKIRSILWDGKRILKRHEIHTPKNLNGFERALKGLIKSGEKIGIGIAGVIKNNKVISATNIKYLNNFKFKILNFKLDNDARCFARAEYKLGAGKGARTVLFITFGTGVGRAYAKNGKVLKIRRFEYAENWEKEYQKIKNKKILAKFLGEKLRLLVDALNPEVVVLGGGVTEKKGYFEAIKNQLSPSVVGTKLEIKKAKLGKFAGAIGATLLWKNWT